MNIENKNTAAPERVSFSIPKRSIWALLGLALLLPFTWLQMKYFVLPGLSEIWALNAKTTTISDVVLVWPTIVGYVLVSAVAMIGVSVFRPLMRFGDEGLASSLVYGLVYGLASSLVFGLVSGLTIGLVHGLVFGLASSLVIGLAYGLMCEFQKPS